LTIADAAEQIGCSTRTIERLKRDGKLEQRLRPQKGSPDVAVFSPESVAEVAAQRRVAPPPFVVGTLPANGNGKGTDTALRNIAGGDNRYSKDDPLHQLCALVLHALQSPPSPPLAESVAERPDYEYLTIREAAAVCRLTQAYVRRRCEAGAVPAIQDRGWKIRRRDLETL
jgi:hypothetical protein